MELRGQKQVSRPSAKCVCARIKRLVILCRDNLHYVTKWLTSRRSKGSLHGFVLWYSPDGSVRMVSSSIKFNIKSIKLQVLKNSILSPSSYLSMSKSRRLLVSLIVLEAGTKQGFFEQDEFSWDCYKFMVSNFPVSCWTFSWR